MKSEMDKKFDKMADEYLEHFGKPYPCNVSASYSLQEHIDIMAHAIADDVPVEEIEYRNDADY